MKQSAGLLLVLAVAVLLGCSDAKIVVLQVAPDGKKLVYDPKNFQSQIQTAEDAAIVVQSGMETLIKAKRRGPKKSAQEISAALYASDWVRLERLVVEYRATHRR